MDKHDKQINVSGWSWNKMNFEEDAVPAPG
jgi:hypothetical protein